MLKIRRKVAHGCLCRGPNQEDGGTSKQHAAWLAKETFVPWNKSGVGIQQGLCTVAR